MRTLGPSPIRTVHLCICSDDPDFRPAVVAIRSAVASSEQSHRFVFHFVTTPELSTRFLAVAKLQLPGIRLEVHADEELQEAIQSRILFRKGAGRRVLASPFNFAPFYLPSFLLASSQTFHARTERLIYFDADIVILGDLAQLFDMNMHGKVCAAVPYCHQQLKTYINFEVLHSLGYEGIDPDSCIANRGLLLVDVVAWKSMKITESIENWLDVYRSSEIDLWVGGMSQPPWLLAMNGNYTRLSDALRPQICAVLCLASDDIASLCDMWSADFVIVSYGLEIRIAHAIVATSNKTHPHGALAP
ncbi:GATL4 [Symbiodinium natans]|uniref:GATL4 protein n=1 Tax=Symbiodinium natans TaxID=878477 RepID=A0A812UM54_9DINO|nr:GATL4 [Symbiodinium natans]